MPETTEITTDANGTVRRRVYGGLYNDVGSAELGVRRFRDAGYPGGHCQLERGSAISLT